MDLTTLGNYNRKSLDLKFCRSAGRSRKVKVGEADMRNSRNQRSRDQKNLMSNHVLRVIWRGCLEGPPQISSLLSVKGVHVIVADSGKSQVIPVSPSEFHTEATDTP